MNVEVIHDVFVSTGLNRIFFEHRSRANEE
jgi:hypothetical protein